MCSRIMARANDKVWSEVWDSDAAGPASPV